MKFETLISQDTNMQNYRWRAGIRSYVTILPLISLLKAAKFCGIGEDWMARNGSKLVMTSFMALTDFYTSKLAVKLFGPSIRLYAVSKY